MTVLVAAEHRSDVLLADLRRHCNDQWRLCVCEPAWGLYCDRILPVAEEFARARQNEVLAARMERYAVMRAPEGGSRG